MIITDKIRKELVGKRLICQGDILSITKGTSYRIIKAEHYNNSYKTLVTVIDNLGEQTYYDLGWFINKKADQIVYDNTIEKYKLSELLNFDEGTEFKDVNSENILQISGGMNKNISVIKENKLAPIIFCERWLNTTYTKLEDESISFTEVCDIVNGNHFAEFMLKFRDNNFNGTFNKILETLSKYGSSYMALQKGKWYLKQNNKNLTLKSFEESIIGEDAGIVDINLKPLYIGDVVNLYINNELEGERVIARNSFGEAFVMGCGGTKIIGGVGELSVKKRYIKIEFAKSYNQFKDGDYVDAIRFIEAK